MNDEAPGDPRGFKSGEREPLREGFGGSLADTTPRFLRASPCMAGYMGFKSEADFERAIERELREMSSHVKGQYGALPQDEQAQPKARKLKGKPGSSERMASVAKVAREAGVHPQLINDAARSAVGEELVRSVQKIQREGFSVEEINRAVELTVAFNQAQAAEMIVQSLDEDAAGVYWDMLVRRVEQNEQAKERHAEEAEETRLRNREELLQEEYAYADSLGPEALDQVDREMKAIDPEVLYDPEMSDDTIRLASRTTAEAARTATSALNTLAAHSALDDAILQGPGRPGSSWTDAEREKWEAELQAETEQAFDNKMGTPEGVTARAIASLQPSEFMDKFNAELDNLSTPPAHEQRLRDESVKAYEAEEEARQMRNL